MSKLVSPELYSKYKHQVLEMSPAVQYYEGTAAKRKSSCLTDQEIAERLGLDVDEVSEIRCIAEVNLLPIETWIQSRNWKQKKAARHFGKRARKR